MTSRAVQLTGSRGVTSETRRPPAGGRTGRRVRLRGTCTASQPRQETTSRRRIGASRCQTIRRETPASSPPASPNCSDESVPAPRLSEAEFGWPPSEPCSPHRVLNPRRRLGQPAEDDSGQLRRSLLTGPPSAAAIWRLDQPAISGRGYGAARRRRRRLDGRAAAEAISARRQWDGKQRRSIPPLAERR